MLGSTWTVEEDEPVGDSVARTVLMRLFSFLLFDNVGRGIVQRWCCIVNAYLQKRRKKNKKVERYGTEVLYLLNVALSFLEKLVRNRFVYFFFLLHFVVLSIYFTICFTPKPTFSYDIFNLNE